MDSRSFKVLVCGSRGYTNTKHLHKSLDKIHEEYPIELVIEGGARGADELASIWATSKGIPNKRVYADWSMHNKAAGPIRNQKMIEMKPDLVVAFPGGKGTQDMKTRAINNNIQLIIIEEELNGQ